MNVVSSLLLAATLGSCAAAGAPPPPSPLATRDVSTLTASLASRSMIGTDWEPVDDPVVLGITYDSRKYGNSLGYEVGLLVSRDSADPGGESVEATIVEGYFGIRNTWGYENATVRPFWGLGGSVLRVLTDSTSSSVLPDFDEDTFGFYFHFGASFKISTSTQLGLEYRLLRGTDLSVQGFGEDVDYGQVGITFGFSF